MTEMECLSLMELLDLRAGADDPQAREHLDGCPRCRALMAALPPEFEMPRLPELTAAVTPRPRPATPDRPRTGQLWRARAAAEPDRSWIVAVIGRAPDADDRVLVVAVVPTPELATERDLIVDEQPLGYPAFLDLQNIGTVLRTQLAEYLGPLRREQAEGLVALYRSVLGSEAQPDGIATGPAAVSEEDPRLPAAQERGQEMRVLWREVNAQVADAPGDEHEHEAQLSESAAVARGTARERGLAELLRPHIEGPEAEWDRAGLLERTGMDGGRFDLFVAGRLDLTDKTDVHDLASVLHVLEVPWDEAEPAVAASLQASPGGRREAEGPAMPMAARSRPGASEDEIARDLFADQSEIDRSAETRRSEIAGYLAELRRTLDELD